MINVPVDAAPGEHYAVVWVQTRTDPRETGGVEQISRVGVRVYLSVGPGGPPAADFEIDSLVAGRSPEGQPFVVAKVHNTGGRALDVNGELTLLDGPGALTAGPFPATLGVTLGIGATESITVQLDDRVPAGPWNAQLTLASGLVERTSQAQLSFPVAGTALSVDLEPVTTNWLPWALGVVVLVLLAIVITLLARRRMRYPMRRP